MPLDIVLSPRVLVPCGFDPGFRMKLCAFRLGLTLGLPLRGLQPLSMVPVFKRASYCIAQIALS